MKECPLVTVYIPTYNRVSFLKRAIKSVLDQTYPNIEIIVVDDVSSDGTVSFLRELHEIEPRVRYFVNDVNSGACFCRNKAIGEARGDFITGLDDDDFFLKERISELVESYLNDDSNKILFTDSLIKSKTRIKKTRRPKMVTHGMLIDENFIGNQIFCKRTLIEGGLAFDQSFRALQDIEAWYRILSANSIVACKVGGASYVVDVSHEQERISKNLEKVISANQLFIKKHNLTGRDAYSFRVGIKAYELGKVSISDIAQAVLFGNRYTVFKLAKLWVKKYLGILAS